MKKNKLILLTFFISYITFAQEKMIKGKLVADGNNMAGINLLNLVNEKSAITDANGEFSILAKEEDMLVFSAENFYYKRKIVDAEDLKKDVIVIEMEPKPIEIEEVIITQFAHLTAYNLGIINYIPKQYTVGERHMISKVGSLAERKARVEGEKKLMLIEKIENLFDTAYFVETLKINSDYVMAFKYYCSEDKDFTKVVNSRIKNDITLAIIELAQKYNALQVEEIAKE
jgi:hypothetical protein